LGLPPVLERHVLPRRNDESLQILGCMRDDDELLTAAELARWLKVGRNYPYEQLRHLALRVGGSEGKPLLRWRRGDILAYLRPETPSGQQAA
jgi:hypothetical protein